MPHRGTEPASAACRFGALPTELHPLPSQPVSSIFPCSPLPSGTWETLGLSIRRCCLPTSSSVCLVSLPLYCSKLQCSTIQRGTILTSGLLSVPSMIARPTSNPSSHQPTRPPIYQPTYPLTHIPTILPLTHPPTYPPINLPTQPWAHQSTVPIH